jgi:hypothetical protein
VLGGGAVKLEDVTPVAQEWHVGGRLGDSGLWRDYDPGRRRSSGQATGIAARTPVTTGRRRSAIVEKMA